MKRRAFSIYLFFSGIIGGTSSAHAFSLYASNVELELTFVNTTDLPTPALFKKIKHQKSNSEIALIEKRFVMQKKITSIDVSVKEKLISWVFTFDSYGSLTEWKSQLDGLQNRGRITPGPLSLRAFRVYKIRNVVIFRQQIV